MPAGIKEQLLFCLPGGIFPAAPPTPTRCPHLPRTLGVAILAFIFLKIHKLNYGLSF